MVFVGGKDDCAERFNKLEIKLLADIVWVVRLIDDDWILSFSMLESMLALVAGMTKTFCCCVGSVDAVAAANRAARALLPSISSEDDETALGEAVIVSRASLFDCFMISANTNLFIMCSLTIAGI